MVGSINGSIAVPQDNLDFPEFNKDAFELWDGIAEWWDDKIGDGNEAQNEFIDPTTQRLLQPESGQTILDITCGAGRMARRIADSGASVVAFDLTTNFLKRAVERSVDYEDRIEFLQGKVDDQNSCRRSARTAPMLPSPPWR